MAHGWRGLCRRNDGAGDTHMLQLATGVILSVYAGAQVQCPSCAVRAGDTGAPAIVVDGDTYSPIMFAANNQFGRDEILLEELRQAAEAGIPFFSFNVHLDFHWTPEEAAEVVDKFCAAHPEGYFYIRIWLGSSPKWIAEHPEECILKADGTRMKWVSPASEAWRETTAAMLRKRVQEIAAGPHGGRFIGVCLANMQTGEWFYWDTNEFMDYSDVNVREFRGWLKREYRTNRRLQAAWGRQDVTFETVQIPGPAERERAVWGPFRDVAAGRALNSMAVVPESALVWSSRARTARSAGW